jgi:hypothetical protein
LVAVKPSLLIYAVGELSTITSSLSPFLKSKGVEAIVNLMNEKFKEHKYLKVQIEGGPFHHNLYYQLP